MTTRRNPINNAVPVQTKEVVTAGTVDQASTYNEGFCPHCQRAMTRTTCAGIPSFVCEEHRTVLPVRSVK